MHYPASVRPSPLNIALAVLLSVISVSLSAYADIYRFVTIDGVETFTDAPLQKNAEIIIKDSRSTKNKNHRNTKVQKIRDISINDVVEKTVLASINPQQPPDNTFFEPRLPLIGTITSGVGMRIDPIDGKWRHHNGIDIAVSEGTPVKAAAAGIVIYSGIRAGYGNAILAPPAPICTSKLGRRVSMSPLHSCRGAACRFPLFIWLPANLKSTFANRFWRMDQFSSPILPHHSTDA